MEFGEMDLEPTIGRLKPHFYDIFQPMQNVSSAVFYSAVHLVISK